jgi:hypothetical protein
VQEQILEAHPDAKLRVYAVWLPMLPTDERFGVADLMVDDRVTHFWDGERLMGRFYAGLAGWPEGQVVWDAAFAYAPDAGWRSKPDEPIGSGGPVIDVAEQLLAALEPYLGG